MSRPLCVITGDVHFTPSTLELATSSVKQAQKKALALEVPLVLNGDTLDTKAIIRAECANRLIELISGSPVETIINTGNHDAISEKSKEHSLNFLRPYCQVVDAPTYSPRLDSYVIPYCNSVDEFVGILKDLPKGSRLIVHQGVQSAHLGHYVVDKSGIPTEAFADYRTIGSHYHRAQDIKCGRPRKGAVGLFSYVGNPYSLSFGEANDGPKGFQILYDDGTLELVPTNLRKHVIKELRAESWQQEVGAQDPKDLLWVKISGPKSTLSTLTKADIAKVVGHAHFKLDLIPDTQTNQVVTSKNQTEEELLDSMVDSAQDTSEYKAYLKTLWRSII